MCGGAALLTGHALLLAVRWMCCAQVKLDSFSLSLQFRLGLLSKSWWREKVCKTYRKMCFKILKLCRCRNGKLCHNTDLVLLFILDGWESRPPLRDFLSFVFVLWCLDSHCLRVLRYYCCCKSYVCHRSSVTEQPARQSELHMVICR